MRLNRFSGLGAALLIVGLAGILLLGVSRGAFGESGLLSGAPPPTRTPGPSPQGTMGPGAMMGPGGMMGGMGQEMMGGMGSMMGGPYASTAKPIAMDEAVRIAERQSQKLGNSDLDFDEVEGYAYNFYVPVKEKSTGNYAFAWVIDRYSGAIMPEMGPNIMWNTKYGMMAGGMIGPGGMMSPGEPQAGQVTPTVDTPVTQEQAVKMAQEFLNSFLPGTRAGDVDTFYGFRTIDVNRDGRQVGMLSVNSSSGAVWYHTWHGDFLEQWERRR